MERQLFYILIGTLSLLAHIIVAQQGGERITGTDIWVNAPFRLGLKSFPGSSLIWQETPSKGFNNYGNNNLSVLVEVQGSPEYQPGGERQLDATWEFVKQDIIDGEEGDSEGWYTLRSQGLPGKFFSIWTPYSEQDPDRTYPVTMEELLDSYNHVHYLLKPVKVIVDKNNYYRLVMKRVPEAGVTYTEAAYEGKHYIQADNQHGRRRLYQEGGHWYGDTLFKIDVSY